METKTNRHGETTSLTKAKALQDAERKARYKHGTWFAWMHKSGDWYVANQGHAGQVEDAELNVDPSSKVYVIGGGGRHSMVFTRFASNIIQVWARNLGVDC